MAKRGKNFNDFERNLVIELVGEKKDIVENKRTDAVFLKEKIAAWEEITRQYNAVSQTGLRTTKQLHALYDFLKKKARSDQHDDRIELYKTGGGSFTRKLDNTGEKIISMLTPQFKPLANAYDSNATFYGEEGAGTSQEITKESDQVMENENCQQDFQVPCTHELIQNKNNSASHSTTKGNPTTQKKAQNKTKKGANTSAASLKLISTSIKKRKITKSSFDKELHTKKCKILDTEQRVKDEISRRTLVIMEKEEKLKDLEIEIKCVELKSKEIELEKKTLELNRIKSLYEFCEHEES